MDIIFSSIIFMFVLIAMGLFIAFSPVLFTAELAVITRSKDSQRDVIYLVAGVATPIILLIILSFLFVDPSKNFNIESPFKPADLTLAPVLDLIVGLIFIISSLFWRRNVNNLASRQIVKDKKSPLISRITSPVTLYWFGFIKMLMSITSLATILLAIRLIKTSINSDILQVFALVLLTVTAISPFVTIAFLERVNPRTFNHVKTASDNMALWNYKKMAANIVFVGGCFLIALGIFS